MLVKPTDVDIDHDGEWVFTDTEDGGLEIRMPRLAPRAANLTIGDVVDIYGNWMECIKVTRDALVFRDAQHPVEPPKLPTSER